MHALRILGLVRMLSPPDVGQRDDKAFTLLALARHDAPLERRRSPRASQRPLLNLRVRGPLAEVVGRTVGRGDVLFIEAHFETIVWKDRVTGRRRRDAAAVLDAFQLLERRAEVASSSDGAALK